MPIIFVSNNIKFIDIIKSQTNYESHHIVIQDYIPKRKTYYVSPANSLCFMDGGIDLALSRIIMPGIERKVKEKMASLNIKNKLGRNYLPIGSSMIVPYDNVKNLIVSPTMLLPQNVSNTNNAYYATMSILYNILINRKEDINNIDIIFTSLCCGYGMMTEEESFKQIINGINDYTKYKPSYCYPDIVLCQPNMSEQPKFYMNTEWFDIRPDEIVYK